MIKVDGLKEMQKKIARVSALLNKGNKDIFNTIGKKGIEIIVSRTKSGVDWKGNSFKKYSKDYKKSGTVDLEVTRRMLDAIDLTAYPKGVRIFIKATSHGNTSSYQLALTHNSGLGKMPKREFFKLSETEVNYLLKMIRTFYQKQINNIF